MSKPFDGWTIVFDLDGTLVNTAPDLLEALNHVLTNADLTPVTLDTIATMIGHGARAMIVKGLLAHGITPSDSDLDVFLEQFLDYYAANIADHSHAFDGVVEAMTTLSAGIRYLRSNSRVYPGLWVASSKVSGDTLRNSFPCNCCWL